LDPGWRVLSAGRLFARRTAFIADSMAVYGPGVLIMPILVVVVAVALVWHAKSSIARGWLR
jgi:hypothetical protein